MATEIETSKDTNTSLDTRKTLALKVSAIADAQKISFPNCTNKHISRKNTEDLKLGEVKGEFLGKYLVCSLLMLKSVDGEICNNIHLSGLCNSDMLITGSTKAPVFQSDS